MYFLRFSTHSSIFCCNFAANIPTDPFMKVTIPYIQQKFDEFNRLMFGGQLPRIPIELKDVKTYIGECVSHKKRLPDGRIQQYDFRLRFNTRYDLSEAILEDTIIHEMIHYYIGYRQLKDSSSHGPVFKRIMQDINTKYGRHLTITHNNSADGAGLVCDTKKRWHVVAIVSFKNGKTGIKVLPRIVQRILHYYRCVGSNQTVDSIRLVMTDNCFFNQYPNSTALYVHYIDRQTLEQHLQGATQIECDGKTVLCR